MSQPIDWSGDWTHIGGHPPKIGEIYLKGTFKNASVSTKVLRIEVECDGAIIEKFIPLEPGADLRGFLAELQQYKNQPFSIAQDIIDNAWEAQN